MIDTPRLLLNKAQDVSILIKSLGKQTLKIKEPMDHLLDILDRLIQLSADRFMSLEGEEESEFVVHPNDIIQARHYSSGILLKLISTEYLFEDDKDDERMERASRLLAHMSGRGAAGSITRTWHIPYLNADGVRQEFSIPLHEPCYVGNDLGFKTWGAAPMLAKKLLQENIIPHLADCTVLELGTGTGMVGLICDHLGAAHVYLTDYHPRVLQNVAYNVQLNQSRAQVAQLDFIELGTEWQDRTFDIVIASDLLYEMDHAEYLPIAINKLMKNDFYFMIPLRDTHWKEVLHFEQKMASLGLVCRKTQDTQQNEEEGLVLFRYYEYTRA